MFDIWDIAKTVLKSTFKLDFVLHANGFKTKSASGLQAIQWAKDQASWPKLEAYCLEDTRLTFLLSQHNKIRLPVRHPAGFYYILQDGARLSLQAGP
eukprot:514665-Rhodomonas_salina.5